MSEPFVGEIRMFSFNYAPRGWALCNGAFMAINQNQALFSIIGTYYGGDGIQTFRLPDLRGRTPVHYGNGIQLGESSGEEAHTLSVNEIPTHNHLAYGSSATATGKTPAGSTWSVPAEANANTYGTGTDGVMSGQALGIAGGSQPHSNMQPYSVLNFCISLTGIYPSRN